MSLTCEREIEVRFSDTDAMAVVWHGNYVRYFEDGREYFGDKFGLRYLDMYENGYFTPIVKMNARYLSTIEFGDRVKIETTLHPNPAAKLEFTYKVFNLTKNKKAAMGSTTQVFMHADTRELELNLPAFYREWLINKGIEF